MHRRVLSVLLSFCLFASFALAGPVQKPKTRKAKPAERKPAPAKPETTTGPTAAKPVAPEPSKKPARADNQWALVVGISKYPGQIQSLNFSRDDAHAVKNLLVKDAGFAEDHIRLLTDDGVGEAKATKQNILAAVDTYLAPRVQPGHEVIVFFAGHGIARGLGQQAKSYLLPADVDAQSKESLERTAVDLEDLSRRLSALKASQFTIFIDACREDPFPGRGIKGNTMTDVMSRGLRITRGSPTAAEATPATSIVFYACKVGERAYEDPELKHGVFTYFILSGIRDLANKPDGRVEAGSLATVLRDNMQKWSTEFQKRARYAVEQTPMMVATQVTGPMVIVRLGQVAANPPSPPAAGSVALFTSPQDAMLSLNGKALGTAPIEKELQAGEYTVRAESQGFQATEAKITVVPGYQQEFTITLKPTATNASYEKGVQFEAQKLWPQAVASYEQALREDPNLMAACERLASAYLAAGRYRDAVDMLTAASERSPDNAALLARRSRALGAWSVQDETLDASINPRPNKAIKYKDAGKEAVKTAELAAKKAPDLAIVNLALGYAYALEERDRPKAIPAFVRASTIAPEDPESYFGVGYGYRLMKQYPQAIPQLKKAIELRSDYYEAHRELAYCYHATGDTDQAIKEYNTASGYQGETSNSGDMAGNHLALSALYAEKGQQVGGTEGEEISKAGKGHETEARDYDPTLKAALKILQGSGVAYRMQSYLPSELRNVVNTQSVPAPGGVRIPFPRKRP
ncbi:MAG TPA: caspase family protein [Blastocatellia bacterium]|nr:caspase family protein [Blastocatellia bacterium]